MAQTKKRRRSKHRGTAAGTVESRGRTGRRPEAGERKSGGSESARDRRTNRLDRPPTWRSAAIRAAAAAGIFCVAIVLLFRRPITEAVPLAAFMILVYLPMGYYTDLFLYRRRQRQKLKAKEGS
jgi:hypothetical protein